MKGEQLEGARFRHPLYQRDSIGVLGTYVTLDAGTGAVHTAPGHGADDFNTGKKYGLEIYAPIGPAGHFLDTVGAVRRHAGVRRQPGRRSRAQGARPAMASGGILAPIPALLAVPQPGHLPRDVAMVYRLDGVRLEPDTMTRRRRANRPAKTRQLGTPAQPPGSTLREAALDAVDHHVKWVPEWGHDRIYNMIANRPDWCISRQRAWGVPIPAVDCAACGEAITTPALVEQAAGVFDTYGADAWYERPTEEFIPEGMTCPSCGGTAFEREMNILDVWFDSGSSHEAVLSVRPDLTWPADIYLEGSDQHRGWFQSSLLVGLGTRGRPPFREILTHGFLIDVDGKKMSKSLGNTMLPQDVIKQSGADIIRLWVAMSDYREEIRVGKEIMARVVEAYRKLRNTLRYLLANLYDFNPAADSRAACSAGRGRSLHPGPIRRRGAAHARRLRAATTTARFPRSSTSSPRSI